MNRVLRPIVVLIMMTCSLASAAQCTDSLRLAPDSLQWVLGGGGDANAQMVKYNDTLYVFGKFLYIGKYTGSHVGLNTTTLAYVNQPTSPKSNGTVNVVIPDGSGGIIIGGNFTQVGDSMRNNLAHINAAGQVTALSATFDLEIYCLLLHNGILYVGGAFYQVNGNNHSKLVSFDMSTGQLTNWNPNVNYNWVKGLATDGTTLYVGGDFDKVNNINRKDLAAFDIATGNLTSWNPGTGSGSFEGVRTMYRHGNTLYVGGDFTGLAGSTRNNIGAFNITTGTLTGFNPNADVGVHNIVAQNGKVYAAGYFTTIGGQARRKFVQLDSISGSATSWNAQVPFFDIGNAIAVSGSTVFIAGRFTDAGGQKRQNFAAQDITTGNALSAKANGYPANVGDAFALCVTGNTVYVGGGFTSIGGYERVNIAGIDLKNDKIIDLKTAVFAYPFIPAARIDNNKLYTVINGGTSLLDPAGIIPGSSYRKHIAVYDVSNGYALTSFNPFDTFTTFTGNVTCMEMSGNYLYLGGNFSFMYNGQKYECLIRMDKTTGVIDTWKPTFFNPIIGSKTVNTLAINNNRLYIGGFFASQTSGAVGNLMYYDLVTNQQGYGAYNDVVSSIYPYRDKIYVGGRFTGFNAFARNKLAAMDTTAAGTLLEWNPSVKNGDVGVVMPHRDKVFVGGYFDTVSGQGRNNFAVIDTGSTRLWPWKPNFYSDISVPVTGFFPVGDTVFVGGSMTDIDGRKIWGLSRFYFDNYTMPHVQVSASDNPACLGSNITLTATSNTGSVNYQWKINGVNAGTNSSTYNYLPNNGDVATVGIKTTGSGCYASDTADSYPLTITVAPKSIPSISITGPLTVGVGNLVNLNANVSNAGSSYSIEWKRNGATFANTSIPSASYTKTAGFDVITALITPAGCYDTASAQAIAIQDGSGVNDIGPAETVHIYPNPAEHVLHITGIAKGTAIRLTDVVGKEMYCSVADNDHATISMEKLTTGNYLLQLTDEDGQKVVKLVVKK